MRIMSFARRWAKLERPSFTTFRYPRKDKDWNIGERIQVFINNRSPHRIFLGVAEIVNKELRVFNNGCLDLLQKKHYITEPEAIADGFDGINDMERFMSEYYGKDYNPVFNKLTMKWLSR